MKPDPPDISRRGRLWVGRFPCMASPCEILVDGGAAADARALIETGCAEARRIERKFSRYRDDNPVHRINSGEPVDVDDETARLLDFADQCYRLSDGLFDITSGILRRAWRFAPGSTLPAQAAIDALLPAIGWERVQWQPPRLQLPPGMEIDFGGIGKEYAVDRIVTLLRERTARAFLVNLGGDCHASGPPAEGGAWITGIEDPNRPGDANAVLRVARGALATSGDAHRVIVHDGVRYGHILDPRSGWPAANAPRSVTVAAATCTEAGVLSTLAMLHGADAEAFLDDQGVKYWCYR